MNRLYNLYFDYLTNDDYEKSCRYYYELNKYYKEIPNAKEYILHYFEIGEKISCWNNLPKLDNMRYKHMFSLFLFGLYFYDNITCIREAINTYIGKMFNNINSNSKYELNLRREFLYYWFLMTLYHDVGTKKEKSEIKECNIEQWVKQYSERLNYLISIYQDIEKLDLSGIPKYYIQRANEYFIEFRGKYQKKHDHGFYAADRFFTKMSSLHNFDHYINEKHFSPEILKWQIYPITLAILMHNIWTKFTTDQETNEISFYEKYMPELISEPGKPIIHLNNHPFLFLLTLTDTIEPIKMFSKGRVDFNEMLHNIMIEVNNGKQLILAYPIQFYNKCRYFNENIFNLCNSITESQCGMKMKYNLAFLEDNKLRINYDNNKLIINF